MTFEKCPWCQFNPGCEQSDFYKECEFRTLAFEKDEIFERLKFEWEETKRLRKIVEEEKDNEKAKDVARVLLDKMNAIQIMMTVLREEFKVPIERLLSDLKIERPGVLDSIRLMAKLKKLKSERGGRR
jgi:predicted small metal-binding protein